MEYRTPTISPLRRRMLEDMRMRKFQPRTQAGYIIYCIDHAGKSITFSGDIDAEGLPDLRRISNGASLLVFNSVVLDPPGSPAILYTLHTPPKTIGEIADEAHVGKLLLSHLSPVIDKARESVSTSISGRYKGTVVFASDGLRVEP